MASVSNTPQKTNTWDEICFPVESVRLASILPDYAILPSDRQHAIVGSPATGKPTIYAIQSEDYSVVPNELLRDVVNSRIPQYEISVRYTDIGEFNINIITPDEVSVGSERLYRNLIINNSYNGKSPFTMQGTLVNDNTIKKTGVRVSYYRQICTNGLMGWADEFLEMDTYLNWLLAGKPKKFKDALDVKESVETRIVKSDVEVEQIVQKKLHHYRLNMDYLQSYLGQVIDQFMAHKGALTTKVYDRLYKMPMKENTIDQLAKQVKIPVQLVKQAQERLKIEERLLQSEPTMWLLYNAFNYSLMNSRASLSLADRYSMDEKVFHELTHQALNVN
ncbi:hypothetical protein GCM10028808_57100 [Spirosoma migulaei]